MIVYNAFLLCIQAATLARGRSVRQSKLLFYGKLAEKALQTYERDGWGEFPTQIVVERREIRPTADRGPILLCVDTSGKARLCCIVLSSFDILTKVPVIEDVLLCALSVVGEIELLLHLLVLHRVLLVLQHIWLASFSLFS